MVQFDNANSRGGHKKMKIRFTDNKKKRITMGHFSTARFDTTPHPVALVSILRYNSGKIEYARDTAWAGIVIHREIVGIDFV
jgi:ASC-1-like (ASCH) protein